MSKKLSRRTFLKKSTGLLGLGTTYLYGCAYLATPTIGAEPDPIKRTVLLCSDIHIGFNDINVDGVVFKNALTDAEKCTESIDYALALGDLVQRGMRNEFEKYCAVRNSSSIKQWYELAGNHEFDGMQDFYSLINKNRTYAVIDGNVVWVLISDEGPDSEGQIGNLTFQWIKNTITKHQDKNIIVCTHQLVRNTVRPRSESHSYFDRAGDYVVNGSTGILDTLRVDLWLNGHQHYFKYDPTVDMAVRTYPKGTTTFINVSSLNFNYNTGESQSFILSMTEGTKSIMAKRRIHDRGIFDAKSTKAISLPYTLKFSKPIIEACPT